jgi:hypothetical protein
MCPIHSTAPVKLSSIQRIMKCIRSVYPGTFTIKFRCRSGPYSGLANPHESSFLTGR